MSKSFNKTILIGRLASNPELKQSDNKNIGEYVEFIVCNITVRDGKEEPNFNRVYALGKQKDLCLKYLSKGDLCCIEGSLDRKTPDSEPRIIAERITFLSAKRPKKSEIEE